MQGTILTACINDLITFKDDHIIVYKVNMV